MQRFERVYWVIRLFLVVQLVWGSSSVCGYTLKYVIVWAIVIDK